jgi:hypothetical protein
MSNYENGYYWVLPDGSPCNGTKEGCLGFSCEEHYKKYYPDAQPGEFTFFTSSNSSVPQFWCGADKDDFLGAWKKLFELNVKEAVPYVHHPNSPTSYLPYLIPAAILAAIYYRMRL